MSPKNPKRNASIKELSPAATAISATGLGLVLKGASEIETIKGVAKIFSGRLFDAVDGGVARALKQESDAGAIVDVTFDKIGMGAISIAAWLKEAIPKPIIAGIASKHLASTALTFVYSHNHPDESFRPTKWGKASIAADTLSYAAYLTENALSNERPDLIGAQKAAHTVGRLAVCASVVAGGISLTQYAKRAFEKTETTNESA